MGSLSVHNLFRQVRSGVYDSEDARFGDLDALVADTITRLFEQMAESEVEHRLGAKLYERSATRQGHRNGSRKRRAQLSFTTITVRIPRMRQEGFVPSFLERNRRAVATTEKWVERAFLCGISRAEIIRLMESTTGCRPSDTLLRRVHEELDRRTGQFRRRPLTGSYEYLFLDAAWVKDIVGAKARRICILTAVGVTSQGEREILGFQRAQRESAASWTLFLQDLMARGLSNSVSLGTLRLVISDEHEGIKKAAEDTFGDVRHQLCWAHRCRNLFEAANKLDRKEMAKSLRPIYQAALPLLPLSLPSTSSSASGANDIRISWPTPRRTLATCRRSSTVPSCTGSTCERATPSSGYSSSCGGPVSDAERSPTANRATGWWAASTCG